MYIIMRWFHLAGTNLYPVTVAASLLRFWRRCVSYPFCSTHPSAFYRCCITTLLILSILGATLYLLPRHCRDSRTYLRASTDNLNMQQYQLKEAFVSEKLSPCAEEAQNVLTTLARHMRYNTSDGILLSPTFVIDPVWQAGRNMIGSSFNTIISQNKIKLRDDIYSRYVVLQELFARSHQFSTDESITISTQSSVEYLNHVVLLVHRWQGPVSVAVWAPGDDLYRAISIISHLRCCYPLVRELVSFSLIYPVLHPPLRPPQPPRTWLNLPDYCPSLLENLTLGYNPWKPGSVYTRQHGLYYPVNAARNVARTWAVPTRLVLTLDVELLPSDGLITSFLQMIHKKNVTNRTLISEDLLTSEKTVFVLPAFEVVADVARPRDKATLLKLLTSKKAVPFHYRRCRLCHIIPELIRWKTMTPQEGSLDIFYVTKWLADWEPVFIAHNTQPLYDERFVGYGVNKIQQAYELCRAGYTFAVLDNAFICHQGISILTKTEWKEKGAIISSNRWQLEMFKRELDEKYDSGTSYSCKYAPKIFQ